jgi:acetolactate synthase I/II/III large subunit
MASMTGTRFFVEMLRAYDVHHVFYVPAILLPGVAELHRTGLTAVSAHGEKAAAYMADGYSRVSGRPSICMSQTVGASNLAAGLKDAYLACSPVIALTGGPFVETKHRHVYQEIADTTLFDGVTKWNAGVELTERLPELLRQAFRVATTGAPGPVHLELRGHQGQITDHEAEMDMAFEPRFARVPAFRPEAEPDAVQEALAALGAAQRPAIVAGGGVIWSGAEAEVVALAERLSIPVATSLSAKATIAERHPLGVGVCGHYARACANRLLSEADLVFYIGSRTSSMVTNHWQLPRPGTPIIHLDIDPEELGRHYPTQVALQGDARATLRRMLSEAAPRSNPAWTDRAQVLVEQWREEVDAVVRSEQAPIRPERLVTEISAALPADGAVVVDTLQASIWSGSMLGLQGPSQRFARCAGSLGWGLPASLGAKCALGERPVVCFTGDGGLYYHLAELETAARCGINTVVVVNNNGSYACEAPTWDRLYGDRQDPAICGSWSFGSLNFAQIARELGCEGVRVERPDQIGDALRAGLASERPVVIDVITDQTAVHPRGWMPEAQEVAP